MNEFIPVNTPLLNGNEKKYLAECIDTNWISSEGPFVKKLECEFSNYSGQKYGCCMSNGSTAIDVAIRAMKDIYCWEDGDEIIVPTFTIISTGQSVVYNGLRPIFVDADPITWNIDTTKIEEKITPKTKAIIVVHIYGLPTDMNPIFLLAKKYGLKIIEDAAQAHGQKYFNQICGGMSDIATFSFYANKHITCGEGGMIMTSSDALYAKARYYHDLCQSVNRFVHFDLGWNCRMSNLQAAVAYAQFEKLGETIEKKKQMGKRYQELLNDIPAQLPCPKTEYAENNYWVFGIVLDEDVVFNAKEAMKKLADLGIGTRPFFYPLHKQPVFEKMHITDAIKRPVSERLYERGLYIPSGVGLTMDQMDIVADKVRSIFS